MPDADFLVLFASTTDSSAPRAVTLRHPANAFLDAFAHAHNRPGHRVVASTGVRGVMRLASADSQRSYREVGLEPMSAGEALDALGRALASDAAEVMVARIGWNVLKPLHEARRPRPFLSRMEQPVVAGDGAAQVGGDDRGVDAAGLGQRLVGLSAESRRDVILEFVRAEVATVLGLECRGCDRG